MLVLEQVRAPAEVLGLVMKIERNPTTITGAHPSHTHTAPAAGHQLPELFFIFGISIQMTGIYHTHPPVLSEKRERRMTGCWRVYAAVGDWRADLRARERAASGIGAERSPRMRRKAPLPAVKTALSPRD